jgi:hypothetical protein
MFFHKDVKYVAAHKEATAFKRPKLSGGEHVVGLNTASQQCSVITAHLLYLKLLKCFRSFEYNNLQSKRHKFSDLSTK